MPLRLIVGFEVRDEDFVTHRPGRSDCAVHPHDAGPGPFCSQCGARFIETEHKTEMTSGAIVLKRYLKVAGDTDPALWRDWVQGTTRTSGAVVVGRCGQSVVLGLLIGHYGSGKRMAWPDHVVAELAIKCDILRGELILGLVAAQSRPINVMLIE